MRPGIDFIGIGVGAVIVNDRGKLFLARRGAGARNEHGLWEFPGGCVEFGERMADALRREVREEYGMEISVGELFDVTDHILVEEGQHWISPAFICAALEDSPRILEPDKCSEIGWFDPDRMPEELTQATRAHLVRYRALLISDCRLRTSE